MDVFLQEIETHGFSVLRAQNHSTNTFYKIETHDRSVLRVHNHSTNTYNKLTFESYAT